MESGTRDGVGRPARIPDGWQERMKQALRSGAYKILSDESLVQRARLGDLPAFDALLARHRNRLYSFALGSLADEKEAGDALSEMAVSAFRDIDSFDARRTPAAWLCLHGFRTVFRRKHVLPGRHTVENHAAMHPRVISPW